jgi:hypothetical protein
MWLLRYLETIVGYYFFGRFVSIIFYWIHEFMLGTVREDHEHTDEAINILFSVTIPSNLRGLCIREACHAA